MFKAKNLSVSYGKRRVLSGLDFEIERGKITAVIGRNGSGKSTLLSALSGAIPCEGEILLDGRPLADIKRAERAKKVAFLPQTMPSPQITVRELVSLGRSPYTGISGRLGKGDTEAVERAISRVGISRIADKRADRISGGELRLSYLAMILAQDTDAVLLDEPSAFMDISNERAMCRILGELRESEGKTIVAAMHSLSAAAGFAERVLVLDGGKIVFCGSVEDCLSKQIIETAFAVTKHTDGKSVWFE